MSVRGWMQDKADARNDSKVGYWSREQVVKMDNRALARLVAVHPKRCPPNLKAELFRQTKTPAVVKMVIPVINVSIPTAEDFLLQIFKLEKPPAPRLSGREIMRRVAYGHGFTMNDLECASRMAPLAKVRHEAMYLVAKETVLSLPHIGKLFGGRDHSTIWHGIRKHADRNGLPRVREGVVA